MFATFLTLALLAAPALLGVAADDTITVNTPTATQCGHVDLTWVAPEGASGTYSVILVNAADPCGEIVDDLGEVKGTSVNWVFKYAAGKNLMLSVADARNEDLEGWSGDIPVKNSTDSSCLDNAAAASSSGLPVISSEPAPAPNPTVEAAGADPSTDPNAGTPDTDGTNPAGALGATSGASTLHMNPFMALCAALAVALAL